MGGKKCQRLRMGDSIRYSEFALEPEGDALVSHANASLTLEQIKHHCPILYY
jgi:hypothetical protein